MQKLADSILTDGKLLSEKFKEAEGMISAGELDYKEFSSPVVRKVVFMQLELTKKGFHRLYGEREVETFRSTARHFLTGVKDGSITSADQREMSKQLKESFPEVVFPK